MSKIIKEFNSVLTEEMLSSLSGKFIHVDVNLHNTVNEKGEEVEVNVWFAGVLAGFDKFTLFYDERSQMFLELPATGYNIILTDGMAYRLSKKGLRILEITEEEFLKLVDDYQKEQAVKDSILLPGKDF